MKFIAVDWSGAQSESSQRRAIWLAEIQDGEFTRVRPGFTRDEVTAELVLALHMDPQVVVGLDFGFSLPLAALDELGVSDAPSLWDLAAGQGETWVDGAGLGNYPLEHLIDDPESFRQTERDVERHGLRPRSTVDIRSRTGNVGRQSLRGFPCLGELSQAGFSIWPFDEPSSHLVIEVYPRALRPYVGGSSKPDPSRSDVCRHLERHARVPHWATQLAQADENAFDAIVSALVLAERLNSAAHPPLGKPYDVEGAIWLPARPEFN